MVEDMIFKLDKRDPVRAEAYHGIDIKPIVIFGYFQFNFTAAKYVAFLPFRLLKLKALFNKLIVVLVKPFKN